MELPTFAGLWSFHSRKMRDVLSKHLSHLMTFGKGWSFWLLFGLKPMVSLGKFLFPLYKRIGCYLVSVMHLLSFFFFWRIACTSLVYLLSLLPNGISSFTKKLTMTYFNLVKDIAVSQSFRVHGHYTWRHLRVSFIILDEISHWFPCSFSIVKYFPK